jgi:hypothetical protein
MTMAWEQLKIGGGGFITGVDVDPTGATFLLRTDTYGLYVGNGADRWTQLVRSDTMPQSWINNFTNGPGWLAYGVYEARVAPSNPNRLYMNYLGNIYRSSDRGSTWTATATSYSSGGADANDAYRTYQQKMAVDTINPDVVYAGSLNGLYVSTNAGSSWALVPGLATPGAAGVTGIIFDPSSANLGGRKSVIYACVHGTGVYRSADAGATWNLLPGSPTTVACAAVASDGILYLAAASPTMYKYTSGVFTTVVKNQQNGFFSVSVDPFDPAHVWFGDDSAGGQMTTDRMATWLEQRPGWGPGYGEKARATHDIPWHITPGENYMSNGTMLFDPTVQNKLWMGGGIGMWYTTDIFNPPTNTSVITFNERSLGIEQLVGRDLCIPPGLGYVFAAGMDRSVFRQSVANQVYPSTYQKMGWSGNLVAAWSVDYSPVNSQHIAACIHHGLSGEPALSGYSLDGGVTWTPFPTQPTNLGMSGQIVVINIDCIILLIGTQWAWKTTNRGVSWTPLTFPGASQATDGPMLHGGYNNRKHPFTVDGVTPSTVYCAFYTKGLYRSVDSGDTWTLVNTQGWDASQSYWHLKLRHVPGQAGHLFATAGQVGNTKPNATSLWRSTDGGSNWSAVPNASEIYDVAIGAIAPGHTYPSIYFIGWYNNVYGIWQSVDNAVTWTQVGPWPMGWLDDVSVIKASPDTYGNIYVAAVGSGYYFGTLNPALTADSHGVATVTGTLTTSAQAPKSVRSTITLTAGTHTIRVRQASGSNPITMSPLLISQQTALSGSVSTTSTVSAPLSLIKTLGASPAGSASPSGAVSLTVRLVGNAAGQAAFYGDFQGIIGLYGNLTGSAIPSANLTRGVLLQGQTTGLTTLASTLGVTPFYAGNAIGVGALLGTLTQTIPLTGVIGGIGRVYGRVFFIQTELLPEVEQAMDTAQRLIDKYGALVELVVFTSGTPIDPQMPWRVNDSGELVQSCKGVFASFDKKLIDGTLIQKNDARVLLAAKGLSRAPDIDGEIRTVDAAWQIVSIKPISPTGVDILYSVQVRR